MRIFVTGASGYIGRSLVDRLIGEGHEVSVLMRKDHPDPFFRHERIKKIDGDLLNEHAISEGMKGCEQVYHLAAYARIWAPDPKTYFSVNVIGTENILRAAEQNGVQKVVFTSTGGTYGISNGKPIHEDLVRTVDFFNEYESSKFMAEERALRFAHRGLNVVIVHPTRVYGPGIWNESNAVTRMIRLYINGRWRFIPGDGRAIGSFAYIDDIVEGHMLSMQRGKLGEKYILGGVNASFNTFFSLLREVSGKNYTLLRMPMKSMLLFGWSQELLAEWFGREPLITRKWIRKYSYDCDCSSAKAIANLGYKVTPLKDGIHKTLEWLNSECKL